jgi:hypothetical protein
VAATAKRSFIPTDPGTLLSPRAVPGLLINPVVPSKCKKAEEVELDPNAKDCLGSTGVITPFVASITQLLSPLPAPPGQVPLPVTIPPTDVTQAKELTVAPAEPPDL